MMLNVITAKRIRSGSLTLALAIGTLFADSSTGHARSGSIDPSFGTSGAVATQIGSDSRINALVLQPDGKIVAAGDTCNGVFPNFTCQIALARYDVDGALDATFGSGGEVITAIGNVAVANGMVLQPDGKLVVAGTGLLRYNADGSLDATFGVGGVVGNAGGAAIVLQPDGKLVTTGAGLRLARYRDDGTVDPTFQTGANVLDSNEGARAIVIQPDAKLVAAGHAFIDNGHYGGYFALVRYNPDGTLDTSFGTGGAVLTQSLVGGANAVAIQADGKLVAAGFASNATGEVEYVALERYLPDGTLDTAFGNGGTMIRPQIGIQGAYGTAIALQPDAKIIAGGYPLDNDGSVILRYQPDGRLDSTFGRGGLVETSTSSLSQLTAMVLQPDGKLVAGGVGFTLFQQSAQRSPVDAVPAAAEESSTLGTTTVQTFGLARFFTAANGTLSPGGGRLLTDCTVEWSVRPVPPPGRGGFPANMLKCTDDDPMCDFGVSTGDKMCTFHIAICLNVAEQRFTCTPPGSIESLRVISPNSDSPGNAIGVANREAIEAALATLGGAVRGSCMNSGPQRGQLCSDSNNCDSSPESGDGVCEGRLIAYEPPLSTTNACTPYLEIKVPLKNGTAAAKTSIRTLAVSSNGTSISLGDLDKLKLMCQPRREH